MIGNATLSPSNSSITTDDAQNIRWLENHMMNTSCSADVYGAHGQSLEDGTGQYHLKDIQYTCTNGDWSDDYTDDYCHTSKFD